VTILNSCFLKTWTFFSICGIFRNVKIFFKICTFSFCNLTIISINEPFLMLGKLFPLLKINEVWRRNNWMGNKKKLAWHEYEVIEKNKEQRWNKQIVGFLWAPSWQRPLQLLLNVCCRLGSTRGRQGFVCSSLARIHEKLIRSGLLGYLLVFWTLNHIK
jgi:hypothetical protein